MASGGGPGQARGLGAVNAVTDLASAHPPRWLPVHRALSSPTPSAFSPCLSPRFPARLSQLQCAVTIYSDSIYIHLLNSRPVSQMVKRMSSSVRQWATHT